MMVTTVYGDQLDSKALEQYFTTLVNLIFKILPMRECKEESLDTYMESLLCELTGFHDLFPDADYDAGVISIMSIVQYLKGSPDCDLKTVRREVFHAISICNKLKARYAAGASAEV